ncbi:recombinase family protein [Micromonospora sediminicola]|uniref:recombinase family protein n=1 Tax=Micromonospora sediminicola TaxID=946078 RepID=UPI0037889A22
MSPFTYRAADYVRQSKKRESGSEASPATQSHANRQRIEQMNAVYVGQYADLGKSAYDGTERPEFDRMIADCHAGRVNLIVVYYISRLSRADPLDAIPVVTDLLNRGVTIVSVNEGEFRKGNLMDLIHLIMRLDAAHTESKNKSVHVRAAKATARELGGYLSGKPPYGFRLQPEDRRTTEGRPIRIQTLAVADAEAAVIRRLVTRVLDTSRATTIVGLTGELNRDGVPTRGQTVGKNTAGSVWSPRVVERILMDPRIAGYAAEVVYAPRTDGRAPSRVAGYRIVRDGDGKPIVAHPEIVDPVDWYAVQARLSGRPTPTGPLGPTPPALLSTLGILLCECGWKMKSHRHSLRGFRSAYRCTRPAGAWQPGQHERDCTVSMDALDDYVARRIFALIATAEDDPETLDIIAEATRLFGLASADPAAAAQRGAISGELDDAEKTLETLYDDRDQGGYSGKVGQRRFLEKERALSDRIEVLTAQLAALDATAAPHLPIAEWLGEPGEDPIGPGSWWDGATLPQRRMFVTLFVREIRVRKAPGRGRPPIESRVSLEWVKPGGPAAPDLEYT